MPNQNYIKGRRHEYEVVNTLKDKGWIAFRSAGSHSPIDVIAIHPKKCLIQAIQMKPTSMSKRAKNKIYQELDKMSHMYFVKFRVLDIEEFRDSEKMSDEMVSTASAAEVVPL